MCTEEGGDVARADVGCAKVVGECEDVGYGWLFLKWRVTTACYSVSMSVVRARSRVSIVFLFVKGGVRIVTKFSRSSRV